MNPVLTTITSKNLQAITFPDAYAAYQKVTTTPFGKNWFRLHKDIDKQITLERISPTGKGYDIVVVFTTGFAYIYGGDSPERFLKNINMNYILQGMGYQVYYKDLIAISPQVIKMFGGIGNNP